MIVKMPMRAQHILELEGRYKWFVQFQNRVYVGGNEFTGYHSRMRKWLEDHVTGYSVLCPHGIVFENAEDAAICYIAYT